MVARGRIAERRAESGCSRAFPMLGLVFGLSSAGWCGLLVQLAFFEHMNWFQPWDITVNRSILVGEPGYFRGGGVCEKLAGGKRVSLWRDCPAALGGLALLGACHSPFRMADSSSPLPGCRHLLGLVAWVGAG